MSISAGHSQLFILGVVQYYDMEGANTSKPLGTELVPVLT